MATEIYSGFYTGTWDPGNLTFTVQSPYTATPVAYDSFYGSPVSSGSPIYDASNSTSQTYVGEAIPLFGGGIITSDGGLTYWSTNNSIAGLFQPIVATTNAFAFCFLSGTLIATPDGEVAVEDLKVGDIVSTANGETRKALWVGEQKISTVFGSPENYPIEICIAALGDNLPKLPLRVSPGHSLLVDGAFPIASAMINGSTVRQLTKDELPEVFTYYHVEVEDHALILAEGVPAETFLDAWSRRTFSNWREYVELYGEEERNVPPSDLHYQRVLKFDDLPQSLKDTLGEPLDAVGEEAA